MPRQILLAKFERKRKQMVFLCLTFVGVVAVLVLSSYLGVVSAQQSIIEAEAVRVAKVVTEQAIAARAVYARNVVDKLSREGVPVTHSYESTLGAAPIPAQFLQLMAHEVNEKNWGLYKYRSISKWNINPSSGLSDDFQRWAFAELEKQQLSIPGMNSKFVPVWRIDDVNGERVLRFLTADPAVSSGCVSCHNAFEQRADVITRRVEIGVEPGKSFKLGELMGAIEAYVPLGRVESIASQNSRSSLNKAIAISFLGLFLVGGISIATFNREKLAEQRAKIDTMTGLLNRTGFLDEGSFALEVCAQTGQRAHLLYLDLNGFKAVNDTHGHEAGDAVLQEIGRRLRDATRNSDLVARLGGDEFCILMVGSNTLDIDGAMSKIRNIVLLPISYGALSLQVGTSIGHAAFPDHSTDLAKLMKLADTAMYQDKQHSKKIPIAG